jgi:hypothetical protein
VALPDEVKQRLDVSSMRHATHGAAVPLVDLRG